MATVNKSKLINIYVVQVSVLLLRLERCHALTALCTALGQPCLNAVLMEDLLAAATLDRAE